MCCLLNQCAHQPVSPPQPTPHHQLDSVRYSRLHPHDSRIHIDLTKQIAQLLNDKNEVVLETDISTGRPTHATPTGEFKIIEKIENKRSNRYGIYHDAKTGSVLGTSADQPKPPKGAILEGYEMPYWMRLTVDGVGMHVGYVVPRQAISYGCIRVPREAQQLFYEKSRRGTPVTIAASPAQPNLPAEPQLATTKTSWFSRIGFNSDSQDSSSNPTSH